MVTGLTNGRWDGRATCLDLFPCQQGSIDFAFMINRRRPHRPTSTYGGPFDRPSRTSPRYRRLQHAYRKPSSPVLSHSPTHAQSSATFSSPPISTMRFTTLAVSLVSLLAFPSELNGAYRECQCHLSIRSNPGICDKQGFLSGLILM
jgi:hypothetical protein